MDTTEALAAAGVAVGVAGFLSLIYQVRTDHSRRRRQATIEFYSATVEMRHDYQTALPPDRDVAAVHALIREVLASKSERDPARDTIVRYLSHHEMLAAGVLDGVFDEKLIRRLAGGRIRALLRAYAPFIHARRDRWNSPKLYDQLEELGRRWGVDFDAFPALLPELEAADTHTSADDGGEEEEE